MSLNICIFSGKLVRDVEVRTLANGAKVANFCIAVNGRKYKKADGTEINECEFVECEAWDSYAEAISKYCQKGDGLQVTTRLKTESWEAADGTKRSKPRFRVTEFSFMGGGRKKEEQKPTQSVKKEVDESAPEEEIPF